MNYTKGTLILVIGLVIQQSCSNQETLKKYDAIGFSIEYPSNWEMTNTNDILNFSPEAKFGAVTISAYSDITFPLDKTKEFIIETNQVQDNPEKVKMTTKQNVTEFFYENIQNDLKWITKVYRKESNLYFLTINCQLNKWDEQKHVFLKVMESFKLK